MIRVTSGSIETHDHMHDSHGKWPWHARAAAAVAKYYFDTARDNNYFFACFIMYVSFSTKKWQFQGISSRYTRPRVDAKQILQELI